MGDNQIKLSDIVKLKDGDSAYINFNKVSIITQDRVHFVTNHSIPSPYKDIDAAQNALDKGSALAVRFNATVSGKQGPTLVVLKNIEIISSHQDGKTCIQTSDPGARYVYVGKPLHEVLAQVENAGRSVPALHGRSNMPLTEQPSGSALGMENNL